MKVLDNKNNKKLPKNIQVALKGASITGAAVGDIASKRVYIGTESLTLMQGSNSDFVETSIAGFVSEDGRDGILGKVVDRSGDNPAIRIKARKVVDFIFMRTVKLGEKDGGEAFEAELKENGEPLF